MRVAMALAAALFAVADSATAQEVRLDGPGADDVRAREVAFAQTMVDRDFEAFQTFVHPEAVFFAGNRPLRGVNAVAAAWESAFEGEQASLSWTPDVVQVLESGDLAFSSGPVLNAAGEVSGRFNSVWRLDASGEWLVIFDKGS